MRPSRRVLRRQRQQTRRWLPGLNLVALMDIFTILVFFLLVNSSLVFDRNKSAIYALYNRALRSNPALRGKMVLRLTIDGSGQVADVQVVSSELGDADLERKVVLRVKRFDFGASNAGTITIQYPIQFFPS